MKLSIAPLLTRSALVGAIPVVIALLLSGVISFSYNRLLKEYRDAVDHTFMVQSAIDAVLLHLQDAETGQRGYIITADEGYLAPLESARGQLPPALDRLRALVSDNADHRPQVVRLERLAADKLAELQDTIAIRKKAGFDPARIEVMRNAGKETMDGIRAVAATMQTTERALFDNRLANARRAERLMIGVAIACVALSLMGRMAAVILRARLTATRRG